MNNQPLRHYKANVRMYMWRTHAHVYNSDMDLALELFHKRGYRPQLAASALVAVEREAKKLLQVLAKVSMAQAMLECANATKH